MTPHEFVYLASQSPRRAQLLDQLGVQHRPLLPDPVENAEALETERAGELPLDYVQRVTRLKLEAARKRLRRRRLPLAPILCADTTVAVGRRILGKPADEAEAAEMLRLLSGRTHRVMTAVAVQAGPVVHAMTCISRVRFAELSDTTIRRYIDSGEPMGKAGAYAIQGRIAAWIAHIDGSHSGIMGLPLFETTQLLARARVRLEL
ncbi:septum formation inhibitor Maf [beta proteobacterium AAP121]|nr:septum formation inhibitor Maf [beta proteobacterium AAP65]KPF94614.1 septum formation inhibitor Maf [beta proteobacterium AAP121]